MSPLELCVFRMYSICLNLIDLCDSAFWVNEIMKSTVY